MIKNAGIFEEISDQYVPEANAAGQGWGTLVTTLTCYGASWALGNEGNFCTGTIECQKTCQ